MQAHDDIVREELNVKEIHYAGGSSPYIEYLVQPNFRRLGPRVGSKLPKVKSALAQVDGATLMREMTSSGKIQLNIEGDVLDLDGEDIQVRLQAKSGWAAAQGKGCVVVLATELTPSLIAEGLARDLVRLIQDLRKTRDCRFADRIAVYLVIDDPKIRESLEPFRDFIAGETLATSIQWVTLPPRVSHSNRLNGATKPSDSACQSNRRSDRTGPQGRDKPGSPSMASTSDVGAMLS